VPEGRHSSTGPVARRTSGRSRGQRNTSSESTAVPSTTVRAFRFPPGAELAWRATRFFRAFDKGGMTGAFQNETLDTN
jgi:hypothetical protein